MTRANKPDTKTPTRSRSRNTPSLSRYASTSQTRNLLDLKEVSPIDEQVGLRRTKEAAKARLLGAFAQINLQVLCELERIKKPS